MQSNLLWPVAFAIGIIAILISFKNFTAVNKYKYRSLFGIGTFFVLLSIGSFRHQSSETPPLFQTEHPYNGIVLLENDPIEKRNTRQTLATLVSFGDSSALSAANERILLYLPKDSSSLRAGQLIGSPLYLREIKNSGNPESFDFERFMRHKGIRYSAYIAEYVVVGETTDNSLLKTANVFRSHISSLLNQIFTGNDEKAFMNAILLGYKQYLPADIREDFSRSGLSHILAVSGLHTGILFMLVMILLWPLRLIRLRKLIYLIALVLMWGYALVTGLSASVVRAVCMISVYLIGKMLDEQSNPMNALFITAFFMLLVRPAYLFDVGFQLSFLAVLSILIYQPLLRIPTSSPLLRPIVGIISVSIAAQILVLPIGLYYFHLVPIWFLPANLLILPLLSPLILLTILDLFLISANISFPFLNALLNDFVALILQINTIFSSLPALMPLYPSKLILLLVFPTLALITCFLIRPKASYLIGSLLAILALTGAIAFQPDPYPKREILVFNQRQANTIHLISEEHHYICSPDSSIEESSLQPIYEAMEKRRGLKKTIILNRDTLLESGIFVRRPFFEIAGKRFCMFTTKEFDKQKAQIKPKIDYVLAGGEYRGNIGALRELVEFDTLILLPTLPRYRQAILQHECDSLEIPLYDISRKGAFRLTIIDR